MATSGQADQEKSESEVRTEVSRQEETEAPSKRSAVLVALGAALAALVVLPRAARTAPKNLTKNSVADFAPDWQPLVT
jgi:hypothetical protein